MFKIRKAKEEEPTAPGQGKSLCYVKTLINLNKINLKSILTFTLNLTFFVTVRIKKRSKVPGVMITQYVEVIPEGMSTPDFTRKPISITIQEGTSRMPLCQNCHIGMFCSTIYIQ